MRGLFYMAARSEPSLFGTLLTVAVVSLLCSVQIVAMRGRVFLANAALEKLPVLVPLLTATLLEIILVALAQTS